MPTAPDAVLPPVSGASAPDEPSLVLAVAGAGGAPDAPGTVLEVAVDAEGAIIVSGAGNAEANGYYFPYGTVNDKVAVSKSGADLVPRITWNTGGDGAWIIELASDAFAYHAPEDVASPDLVAEWTADGDPPAPTVTLASIDSPEAVLAAPSEGSAPTSPGVVIPEAGGGSAPTAPGVVLATAGEGSAPDAPVLVLAETGADSPPLAPVAVLGMTGYELLNSNNIPLRNTNGTILLDTRAV